MEEHGIQYFVFSSSAAVYGSPEHPILKETDVLKPINPYGKTKLMVEQILQDVKSIRSISLRYFNAAGGDPQGLLKNFRKKETNLIPIVLKKLREQEPIHVFGTDWPTRDGTCVRDYIHVMDLAQAHLLALEALFENAPTQSLNLGNGTGYTVKEVIQTAKEVTGIEPIIVETGRRDGDPAFLVADASLAKKVLGWQPRYPELKSIVQNAWDAIQ